VRDGDEVDGSVTIRETPHVEEELLCDCVGVRYLLHYNYEHRLCQRNSKLDLHGHPQYLKNRTTTGRPSTVGNGNLGFV
jgi:hypothetical protein